MLLLLSSLHTLLKPGHKQALLSANARLKLPGFHHYRATVTRSSGLGHGSWVEHLCSMCKAWVQSPANKRLQEGSGYQFQTDTPTQKSKLKPEPRVLVHVQSQGFRRLRQDTKFKASLSKRQALSNSLNKI